MEHSDCNSTFNDTRQLKEGRKKVRQEITQQYEVKSVIYSSKVQPQS